METGTAQGRDQQADKAEDLSSIVRELRLELKASQAERMSALAELRQMSLEREDGNRERKELLRQLEAARTRQAELSSQLEEQAALLEERRTEWSRQLEGCHAALLDEQRQRADLQESISWKITSPLRAAMRAVRGFSRR